MKNLILFVVSAAIAVTIWSIFHSRGVGTWNGRSIDEYLATAPGSGGHKRFELHVARVESAEANFGTLFSEARTELKNPHPSDAFLDRISHLFDSSSMGVPPGWVEAITSMKGSRNSPWTLRAYTDRTKNGTQYIIEAVADIKLGVCTNAAAEQAALEWLFERKGSAPSGWEGTLKGIAQDPGFEQAFESLK